MSKCSKKCNKIKVGEYVRTISGNIDKVDALYGMIENTILLENHKWQSTKNILKHSKNIIDLIEVGDYVNGKKIEAILDGGFKSEGVAERVLCFETDFPIEKGLRCYHNYDIKSIVTKEQFSEMEYKV